MGVRVIRFLQKFQIPCRMTLVDTVPIPKSVAQKLQKLYNRSFHKCGTTTTTDNDTNPARLGLVKRKFC